MPVTRYYGISAGDIPPAFVPGSEQSTAFPWGTNGTTYTQGPEYVALDTAPVATAPGAITQFSSLAQTARQSQQCATLFYELAAQTIPAGNWSFASAVAETNAAANSFFGVAIYVWRPSTLTKVATITDAQVQRGAEWGTATSSRLFTVAGSAATTENGDVLIVELWRTAAQGMGTAYAQTWNFNAQSGNGDFTADGQTNLNSWMDAPETLQPPTGPIEVVPGVGEATATGFAPTATASDNQTVTTDTGAVSATGFAPAAQISTTVRPDTGLATATGFAPSAAVSANQTVSPALGEVTADGFAPTATASDNQTVTAALGELTAAGFAPAVTASAGIAVSPVATRQLAVPPALVPGEVAVSLTATALRVFGVAPTVAPTATLQVSPTTARLLGVAPAVAPSIDLAVPFARVTDSAFAPTVSVSTNVAVSPVALSMFALEPSLEAFIPVTSSVLTLSAVAPAVSGGGGPGLVTIPRKGGDSSSSIVYYPPTP